MRTFQHWLLDLTTYHNLSAFNASINKIDNVFFTISNEFTGMNKILLVYLFCMVLRIAHSQDPYSISFTEINGLSSNHVYDVYQDKKGFMWFATDGGLCRYDGFQFLSFGNNEQLSKSGSYISEDDFGRIWYMNFDGYLFYTIVSNLQLEGELKEFGLLLCNCNAYFFFSGDVFPGY